MDDQKFGTRNKRGDFAPSAPLESAPLFVWPPRPGKLLAWLPHYFLPWNALFFAFGAAIWFVATPSRAAMQTFDWHWIGYLWLRNSAIVFILYGLMELRLYVQRKQGNRFKFNGIFPGDKKSDVFLFGSQTLDNILRSFGTGVAIWTAYEVVMLHLWAVGWGPWTTFDAHPWLLVTVGLLIPLFHEAHSTAYTG